MSRETKNRNKAYHSSRIRMAGLLSARLKSLNNLGLANISGGTPEIVLNAIKEGYASARAETSGLDLNSLRRELTRLESDIAKYGRELKGLVPEGKARKAIPASSGWKTRSLPRRPLS